MRTNQKFLTMDNLNPAVINMQYAVRGAVVMRAAELEKELESEQVNINFDTSILFHVILFEFYFNNLPTI